MYSGIVSHSLGAKNAANNYNKISKTLPEAEFPTGIDEHFLILNDQGVKPHDT
ncbi:hypothetical protein [Deinococcus sp. JMULE3]|uniref:hypothetical protein n=1 Tax=Deinococcus sp. JMULE3 TaxID=2518341 RepID=UPI001577044C|nr:hypothetical protein [Deinococcus sp. JMULE3]